MSIFIFIVILIILVLVHEFGHFFSAKKFGIRVDEFGFGFPPKLFSFKKGETEYTFNLVPLGGFVKIFGENPDEENISGPDSARSFVNKPAWQQAIVLFAGVFMNFMLAWFLFSISFMSGSLTSLGSEPKGFTLDNVNTTIISVLKNSPADRVGLKSGDKIFSIANNEISPNSNSIQTIQYLISQSKDKEVDVSFFRGQDKSIHTVKVIPVLNSNNKPSIGIALDQIGTLKLPFFKAIEAGFSQSVFAVKEITHGLYSLIRDAFKGHPSLQSVTGPVGMVGVVGDAYKFGFTYLLSFAAMISINLAVVNLLPFPALDGGRLFFLIIEKIKGSRIKSSIQNITNITGFILLILLMLFVTYHDILKIFGR